MMRAGYRVKYAAVLVFGLCAFGALAAAKKEHNFSTDRAEYRRLVRELELELERRFSEDAIWVDVDRKPELLAALGLAAELRSGRLVRVLLARVDYQPEPFTEQTRIKPMSELFPAWHAVRMAGLRAVGPLFEAIRKTELGEDPIKRARVVLWADCLRMVYSDGGWGGDTALHRLRLEIKNCQDPAEKARLEAVLDHHGFKRLR